MVENLQTGELCAVLRPRADKIPLPRSETAESPKGEGSEVVVGA